ncbi:C2 domain-containing protein [Gamsiella multidivaricata]|uniref:C2 domain-containing protein n=1 Tax=Gamsiella multidivaricata TaxID=101098 RepID=UPI00221E9E80|nr:C2 domain-containing protein [Gamsiella multidivaricata]KAI7818249.1 C2 domain-containing protein [Gamsiella multidivaricata]
MDPTQQPTGQTVPGPETINGLDIAPPRADDDFPSPQIPGQARLNEAVGKAIGGTVIPSDIRPVDLPTTEKLDAKRAEAINGDQPSAPSSDKTEKAPTVATGDGSPEKDAAVKPSVVEDLKNRIPGAFPTVTRIGWIEAYKRTDGPTNEFRDKSIWMEEFASSALFGAFWHNAAALFVIPVVCFAVFKLGGGFVSLVLIIAFGATYYKNSIRRFRRNARDDITRELIKNALENDVETTEWINNFMSKFWLIYEPVLSSTVVQTVDGILVDQTPAFLDSIRLTTFTLGTKAPRVESVKAFPKTDPDVVLMDWRVSFTPTDIEDMTPRQLRTQINPKICLTIRVGKGIIGAGIPILVEDMSFKGHMRFKLKLMSNFPHVKTVDFCFLEPPEIDYVLKPVGGETFGMDIMNIPGLQSFIRDQTHAILGPMMYAPNVYTLDLEQMMTGGASLTAAAGVVQFTIYNAKDLKNTELVGNSDPYCKIRLGNRPELATTAVKEDTLNPVWNETNTILVNNLNEVVCMELFDKDNVRKDRPLGQANFDLKSLEEDPIQDDVWCKVLRNGKERGAVRVRAAYFPVQVPQPSADGTTMIPVESNSGILAINLAQAKDIARSGKTKSHCEVYLNGKVVHTTKSMSGASPAWGADLDVFVTDLEAAQLTVEVISDSHVIGSYGVSAKKLIKDTTDKVDWVNLQGGEGISKLKINGVWKPILMSDDMNPSAHKPAFGVIRIQMLGARELRNVEIGGNSDPYVVITGDKGISRGRTKVIDSNLNPVWNEIFYVAVNSMKQTFEFECFDFQKVTKDRTLGRTEFAVAELVEELPDKAGYVARPAIDRWAPLKQKDGSTKGELHYELSFYPSLKLAQEATEAEKSTAAVPAEKIETVETVDPSPSNLENSIRAPTEAAAVTLPPGTIPAQEALDYDSGILVTHLIGAQLDRSGTYCEFYIDSDSYQFKSQLQKSRNPKWNEVADIFVKELEYAKLIIVVKEKSSVDKDPVVGVFTQHIRTLLETTPADGASFPIVDKHDQRGSLHLKFEYLPVNIELLPKERLDNMGNLTVNLVRAKNLIAADRGGASDPYLVFKVNGKEVYKSEVVKKTLNPEYNESFVVPISSRVDDQFTFEVFDWNQLSTAKSLGVGSLNLRNIQLVLPNDFLVSLRNKHNQGEVQLRIKFMPEFLSASKKAGFASTFIGGVGQAGMAGVGVVTGGVGFMADGVGAVGQGALDVGGAVGKGALKGVGTVGKGVGTVGKGVFGGISAGASALGLRKDKSDSRASLDSLPPAPAPVPALAPTLAPAPAPAPEMTTAMMPQSSDINSQATVRPSNSETSLNVVSSSVPRTSVGSVRSHTSMGLESGDIVGEPGNLTIHVVEADGLLGVDKSGTSDPYVRVSIGGKSLFKTKVKKENLSPNWSESMVVPNLTGHPVTINFMVRDHNTIGSDKDLGEFELRLWEYIQPSTDAHPGEYRADFWGPLSGSGGRLHLALEFEPSLEGAKQKRGLFGRK